jgi:hypothetical protein
MNRLASLLLLALLPAISFARSVDVCPVLPRSSGLAWHFQNGLDSASCQAIRVVDKKTLFSVYLGNHPDFDPETTTRMATGVVGGRTATWYRGVTIHDQDYLLGTVLLVPGGTTELPLKAYVRVEHQRRGDLRQTLSAIAAMQFNARWYHKP